ncbi:MAG: asparagine synthase (glutamine-hydrolyzing) [Candidatus Aminicenantes bacterium]|nr:asparagine synthase (glutamine-hydrolyzing) [Candidatus Aminicenantes bacterium]
MCGICGVYNATGLGDKDWAGVRRMCEFLVHRGPDGAGFHFGDRIALGMRRLKVIDLVTGDQPIYNEDHSVAVVYNGEIYNFPDLRRELEDKGHKFSTNADTEVIVHLYEDKGEDFVQALNGMFAVALWDLKRRKLLLVRDRLGIKPLHYLEWNGRLYFASEIKALLSAGCPREIDPEALSQFFSFEYIPAPRSIFRGIKKLPPGHMMVVEDGATRIASYWNVRFTAGLSDPRPEEEYAAEVVSRLRESVRLRLLSDVPLGLFLSGGVDSSSVAALMAEVVPGHVRTFSIGFKEESFDEIPYARQISEAFHTDHTEFVVESAQVKGLVPHLMEYLDEPLADASIIPTYIISSLARPNVTVALAGDGGDELFCGYDTYKAWRVARRYRKLPKLIRTTLARKVAGLLPASEKRLSFEFKAKKFLAGIDYPPEVANAIWWGAYPPAEKTSLFAPDFQEVISRDPFEPIHDHLARYAPDDELDRLSYLDLKLYLQDDLLVKVDRMSMANSLEIRVPFLDYTFVEFAASIPHSLKLKGMTTKHILKKAMEKKLPAEILERKKIGFDIPLGPWLQSELKEFAHDVLSPNRLKSHGYFNETYVRRILDEHMNGTHNHRQLLWPLIIFQFWYDRYLKG